MTKLITKLTFVIFYIFIRLLLWLFLILFYLYKDERISKTVFLQFCIFDGLLRTQNDKNIWKGFQFSWTFCERLNKSIIDDYHEKHMYDKTYKYIIILSAKSKLFLKIKIGQRKPTLILTKLIIRSIELNNYQ